jgi:hypothetical protein
MYQSEVPYFIGFSLIILLTPFLPSNILLLADNFIVRVILVLLLIYLIGCGPTAGLFGLLAIGVIYLERNRRKIIVARKRFDTIDTNYIPQMTVEQESQSQQTVPVVSFNLPPDNDEMSYIPTEECGSDHWEPVAPSMNMKIVLPTSYPISKHGAEEGASPALDNFYEDHGYGHIDGVQTLGNEH